ncbi:MAG: helix-turn-helix transcriptional regulator [Alphaproteobacteria bacterium]|nr:helix-turn-helix transcriptional regulator [Alphaproteobacteria bacterium]
MREAVAKPTPVRKLYRELLRNPAFRREYDALEEEFRLAAELIEARSRAGLSQGDVARRMGTSQPAVARLESGRHRPTTRSIEAYAKATGHRVEIRLVPIVSKKAATKRRPKTAA